VYTKLVQHLLQLRVLQVDLCVIALLLREQAPVQV
jgi:hypothetical protein